MYSVYVYTCIVCIIIICNNNYVYLVVYMYCMYIIIICNNNYVYLVVYMFYYIIYPFFYVSLQRTRSDCTLQSEAVNRLKVQFYNNYTYTVHCV